MPHVINGVGTWYYGKKRIHTRKGTCEFCNRSVDLASYDTTLFFVVIFIPLIPLQRKRILQQCSVCQRHRVLSLAKWEEAKARDGADLLEKLQSNPDDRDTLMRAIGFTLAYQDEPLLNSIVETFTVNRAGDAAIQTQLGNAYAYFARWSDAEQAYRASLAIEDNEAVREQLALALLKQNRPTEARPYLQHVIANKKRASAGLIYVLVNGYQALGLHDEALAIIDERDQAFPDWASGKEYQKQRKTSTRYRGTEKKIRSASIAETNTGYREGNWTARVPSLVGALILLALVALYLGSAVWIGQARKVFLVNGTGQPYTVVAQGVEHALPANSFTAVRIVEGDLQVAFKDARPGLEPVQTQIQTSFWSRPFVGHTFVINPDQSAVVLEEEAYYAVANARAPAPAQIHVGSNFYSLPGVDYEFESFPPTIQVKGNNEIRKTRVAMAPPLTGDQRVGLLQRLAPAEQLKVCKTQMNIDPKITPLLNWLVGQLAVEETIAYLEPRLDDRPILVEWHRMYQTLMEHVHPETDLLPRYRKLVADSNGQTDALYLLGRVEPDLDEGDKLYRQAASANSPSGYALAALGYRALCEGRFGEARDWLEKALPILPEGSVQRSRSLRDEALLANGDYDALLKALQAEVQTPALKFQSTVQMIRVQAIRGDKAKVQQLLTDVVQKMCEPSDRDQVQKALEAMVCCCQNDVAGFLKRSENPPSFEAEFLRGKFKEAADLAQSGNVNASAAHGLLYLEASRSGAKDVAEANWTALLADLNKGGHEERLFAEVLTGKKNVATRLAQRLPIDSGTKCVLLTVLAQRNPDQSKELLTLAKKLNYHHDAISICLAQFLPKA